MAGILDWFGLGDSGNQGILAPAQPAIPDMSSIMAPQSGWRRSLGLIGSTLQDMGAHLGGRGDQATHLDQFDQQDQKAKLMQLMAATQSPDPNVRQRVYAMLPLLGIDPKPFQAQAASQAMPKLLDALKPQFNDVQVTPKVTADNRGPSMDAMGSPMLSTASPSRQAVYNAPIMSPPPLADALRSAGVPELTQLYAGDIIKQRIAQEADAAKPYDLVPGQHHIVNGVDVMSIPEKPTPNSPFNPDGTPNLAFQKYEKGKIAEQQGPEWARLAFEKSKEGDAKFTAPMTVEAADPKNPGQRTQFLAQQDKKTGQWYSGDQNRVPLTDVMLPGGVPGGGRAAAQISRIMGAAKDVSTGLQNVSQLPITASTGLMGLLGGKQEAHSLWDASRTVLANQMTPQEVQSTKAMYVGIAKAIGTLDAGGLQTSDTFLKQIGGLLPADGDTHMTKLLKLAELRQQADNALESQLNGPLLSSQQKVYAKELRASLAKSIPWTPTDVLALDKSADPNAKISDFAKGAGLNQKPKPPLMPPLPLKTDPKTDALLKKYGIQ